MSAILSLILDFVLDILTAAWFWIAIGVLVAFLLLRALYRKLKTWALGYLLYSRSFSTDGVFVGESLELIEKIERLSAELESEKQTTVDVETWISLLRQYSYPTELTAELLNGLIEKIVIHEATTEDGVREQNIDIYYRLIGKIE